MTKDLTPEQSAALEAFAERHGDKDWRDALSIAWANCSEPADLKAELRQVRNQFGPTWLHDEYAYLWRGVLPAWEFMPRWTDTPPVKTPGLAQWSATFDPPAIGARVQVRTNSLGPAVVTGYFVEAGYLGVIVKLEEPADWYVKQNGGDVPGHSFGTEITEL